MKKKDIFLLAQTLLKTAAYKSIGPCLPSWRHRILGELRMQKHLRICAAAALVVTAAGAQAASVTVTKDTNNPVSIPGLTGFATTGALMSGMSVTATFSNNNFSQTLAWASTGGNSGGVTGTGWGLSVNGDTFNVAWNFSINPNSNLGELTSLILDGASGLTVFDTTNPDPGTSGSAAGRDFVFNNGCEFCAATAEYSKAVAISPNAPVGDLFHRLTVTFVNNDTGALIRPGSDWSFFQDTDNDSRITQVPEPGSIALAGLALLALGATRRRRARE